MDFGTELRRAGASGRISVVTALRRHAAGFLESHMNSPSGSQPTLQEILFQREEKAKRAAELIIANKELAFQTDEKGKRAAELIIANKELALLQQLVLLL